MTSPEYTYVIDASDRIVSVDPNWLAFASENDAPHLTERAVLGKTIWNYVSDSTCREVYGMLFANVREHASSIRIPFRCDSPTVERFMELTISLAAEGNLQLAGRTVRENPRPYQALLDSKVARSNDWVTVCAWCKKVRNVQDDWLEVAQAAQEMRFFELPELPNLTHGMCPKCFDTVMQELFDKGAT